MMVNIETELNPLELNDAMSTFHALLLRTKEHGKI